MKLHFSQVICMENLNSIDREILRLIEKKVDILKKMIQNGKIGMNYEIAASLISETNLNPVRIHRIFEEIEKLLKEEEKRILGFEKKVAVLGPIGSFSEEMAINLVGSRDPIEYFQTTTEVIEAVEGSKVDYGIVPIENSTNGTVFPVLDALLNYDVEVFGEATLEINQCLATKKSMNLKDIKTVYSHPQGISQCMRFINNYLSHAEIKYTASTADGVNLLDENSAVIMSETGAKYYKLHVVRKKIQDFLGNTTRFYAIRKKRSEREFRNGKITALFFGVEDKPGSLKNVLEIFYKNGFNLRKLESRPAKTKLGDYIFFTEVEASLSYKHMEELRKAVTFHRVIGIFKEIEEIDVLR
ncbi:MAG: prephenate dehydratase [Thermotogae bacterium]|nr:prephenate dehydratase [Thermotogota bacterium]